MSNFKDNQWVKDLEEAAKNIVELLEESESGFASYAMVLQENVSRVIKAWYTQEGLDALEKWYELKYKYPLTKSSRVS